ncbi:MAG TPA: DUF1080 domain-containing protein [Bryobacteraceae bacterium]|nr:DUF1080 domain-containing protein [Bryobacteraceae bacterium]
MRSAVAFFLVGLSLSFAADNVLSPEEKKDGWKLLFDGKTMKGWQDPAKKSVPGSAWKVENGALATAKKPNLEEDLITEQSFGDFELKFDWRVAPGGNTGLKYRIQKEVFVADAKKQTGPGGFEGIIGRELASSASDRKQMAHDSKGFVYTVAFEFQLIDDERHPDALRGPSRQTGALYSMIPAKAKAAHPAGEWNSSLLRVKGQDFEHWVNGTKVLEGSLKDPVVAEGAAKRWGQYAPTVRDMLTNPRPSGPFALQHHGDDVWFRNIKVRTLK